MHHVLKTTGAAVALALLAACGGSDDPAKPTYSEKQLQELAFDVIGISLGVPQVTISAAGQALSFLDDGAPSGPQPCDDGGTYTATLTRASSGPIPGNGDKVDIQFDRCDDDDVVLTGKTTVTFSDVSGDIFDNDEPAAATMTFPFRGMKVDDDTTLDGDFVLKAATMPGGAPDTDDGTSTLKISGAVKLTESGVSMEISEYASEFSTDHATDTDTMTKVDYRAKGSRSPLGEFDYRVSLTSPVVARIAFGELISGGLRAKTDAETVDTTIATSDKGVTTISVKSSSGKSTSITEGDL
jgi:hypothetical protein